jgi:ribonuclease P protein component
MPRSARRQGYSRRHRFTTRGSFGPVLRASRKLRGELAVLHVAPGRGAHSRLGIALTRRLVASSVDRNRVKRVVREVFRRHPAKALGLDCVMMLRARYRDGESAAIAAEFGALLDQLHARVA